MEQFLFHLLAPGEKLPSEGVRFTVGYDGLSWGWAFFALVALVIAVVWSYRRFAPKLGRFTRTGLIILRSLLFLLLLILLVRPVLLITLDESVRRPLLVLIDETQSMQLADQRSRPDDLARAAIAKGVIAPGDGLAQAVPADAAKDLKQTTRLQLLEMLAANPKLNLWPRLQDHADLEFYGFGRTITDLGGLKPAEGAKLTPEQSAAFFHNLHADQNRTAIGDSLRELLDDQRGQTIAGVLLITDGANNNGIGPTDAAAMAREDGVPLFIYGVGVTTPQDIMVSELSGPDASNVKERVNLTVHIRAQSMLGKKSTVQLKADGRIVDEEPVEFRADGEQEVSVGYVPTELGDVALEATVMPLREEAVKDNNTARTRLHVVDEKIGVLLIDSTPRWDYQYLLATLQRDRRIKLKTFLVNGDPGLSSTPDSPYLDKLPDNKDTLFSNQVIIIGDVDPGDIGDTRMKLLVDWVNRIGGGLIFLAGPNFDPAAYHGTPLEPLVPVETTGTAAEPYADPMALKLTPAGETSGLLALSNNPQENLAIWQSLAGVRWTAGVGRARPAAQTLLVDPTASRATPEGPMPVMALQSYGLGQTLFIGTQETYRWRSKLGEKYYARIWGQIIQAFSGEQGGSALTKLKADRPRYLTGDHVRISAHIFKGSFEPQTDPEVPGTVTRKSPSAPGQTAAAPQMTELRLQAVPDQPGEYRGEMVAQAAGDYSFSTVADPAVVLKFEVAEPQVELSDIAMNEKLLRAMAEAGGGRFFREEDLDKLPALMLSSMADSVDFHKIPLVFAPFVFGLIVFIACLEWLWRRKLELK